MIELNEMDLEEFRDALIEEEIEVIDAAIYAESMAEASTSLIERLRWLQEPLLVPNYWADSYDYESWSYPFWSDEYIGLMGHIITNCQNVEETESSRIVHELLDDQDIWLSAVAPAALLVQGSINETEVNSLLARFVDSWNLDSATAPTSKGFGIVGVHELVDLTAPLLAITCLNPLADLDLAKRTTLICSTTTEGGSNFCVAFWEYIAAYLQAAHVGAEWWAPHSWWNLGFFDTNVSGLTLENSRIGQPQLAQLLEIFLANYSDWNFTNEKGKHVTVSHVARAFASRPELEEDQRLMITAIPLTEKPS